MKQETAFLCAALAAFSASATTYYVSTAGSDANNGLTPGTAFASISKGWTTCGGTANMELIVAPGTYAINIRLGKESSGFVLRGSTGNPADVVLNMGSGSVATARKVTLRDVTFSNSTANVSGEGIYRFGYMEAYSTESEHTVVSNCVFTCNRNTSASGCTASVYAYAKIMDSVFRGNTSNYSCVTIRGSAATIKRCSFVANEATLGAGGAILVENTFGNVVIRDCLIDGNSANYGGGVCVYGNGTNAFELSGCVIRGNQANISGGGVWGNAFTESNRAVITGCQIVGNTVTNGPGGGLFLHSYWDVSNCTIASNFMPYVETNRLMGAGAWAECGRFTDCAFVGNSNGAHVVNYGGGLFISIKGTVSNCLFNGNFAPHGGGIAISGGVDVDISRCTVINNSALGYYMDVNPRFRGYGGGICNVDDAEIYGSISSCIVTGNVATSWGGGMLIRDCRTNGAPFIIRNCLIAQNAIDPATPSASSAYPGGIYFVSYTHVMDSCTIVSNTTPSSNPAAGIYNRWAGNTVTNTILAFNLSNGNLSSITGQDADKADYNYCCAYPAQGLFTAAKHCVNGNPGFVDPAHGNWRIAEAKSPCAKKGLVENWMARELDVGGNPRIWDSATDIGCYQRKYALGTVVSLR